MWKTNSTTAIAETDENRGDDVERDRQHRDYDHDQKVECGADAQRPGRVAEPAKEPQAPQIEMLNRDHHDHRRERDARNIAEPAEQQRTRDQQRRGIDQHRERRTRAERPVGDAGADIDAAGDAAEACGRQIGDAEPQQNAGRRPAAARRAPSPAWCTAARRSRRSWPAPARRRRWSARRRTDRRCA